MSSPTNPATDLGELLSQLKKTFDETSEDVSSAKGVRKLIDQYLKNQFPLDEKYEQELRRLCKTTQPSHFHSIRKKLLEINNLLRQRADEANQDNFQPLSDGEQKIVGTADNDQLLKRLRVSYEFFFRPGDELKRDPRICLFLAIFPGNAVLRKRFLIYWWIGEGLVPSEEEGERVFEELLDLELLIPHGTDNCPRVSKCQISPWIRYMLISEATKEMLLNVEGGIPRFDPGHSQRTCLIAGHTNLEKESEFVPENLRTICNVNKRDLDFQRQWLAKRKRLVVLQLGRWQVSPTHHIVVRDESFLTGLKTQKLLKYLSLRGISRITSLPDSIRGLVSLEILDLKACHNLETLPDTVASLKKLTHLDVSDCYLLGSMPKGLHNCTSLQVLKGFIIGNSKMTPIRVEHLPSLKNLKRLSIYLWIEATTQKEDFDQLKDLKKVKCLKISWGKEELIKSLSFPPELKKLVLEGIPHEMMPEWLNPSKLMKLETLYIKGGNLGNLPDTGRWNNVKYLVLKYTKMPTINIETLKPMFPSLQYVKKVNWVERSGKEELEFEWPSTRMHGAVTN